jgi:hypothetical protein
MTPSPARHFLGWNGPVLVAAVEWLWAEYGGGFGAVTVAVPGGRAGRKLLELLARRASEDGGELVPPRVVTGGQLTDELVQLALPAAGRLARTLAWDRALGRLSKKELWAVAPRPPAEGDLAGRMRLAERLRTLHGELAAEGLTFEDVGRSEFGADNGGESRRWKALAAAQGHYRELLAQAGRCDPHEGRRAAVEAGRLATGGPVVLVGVVQQNAILRRVLEAVAERVVVLVGAPEEEAGGFDEYGALVSAAWQERNVGLDLDRWVVADNPEDQARRALSTMAAWNGRYSAEQITVGVCDGELAPYLARRLGAEGVTARWAEGTPLARTGPVQLVSAVARFLDRGRFASMAELARHPALEKRVWERVPVEILKEVKEKDGPELLDAFQRRHLPGHVPVEGVPVAAGAGSEAANSWIPAGAKQRGAAVAAWHRGLLDELGELTSRAERPLAEWCGPLRTLLAAVYGERELRPEADEDDRQLASALRSLGRALDMIEEVPPQLMARTNGGGDGEARASAAETITLVLAELEGQFIPPPPEAAAVPTVELLGWLELALDDAPALVVTGFNEGRVPASVHGDPFLPDGLRRTLDLPDNDARLARDVYTTELILRSRAEAVFISGRRSAASDSLTPSRILFHRDEEEIPARVSHFLAVEPRRDTPEEQSAGASELPRLAGASLDENPLVMTVTSFRKFLSSPYLFYVERVLDLETLDDRARELDPLNFGNLAHQVLERFGTRGPADSTDEKTIEDWLVRTLDHRAAHLFGVDPLPAVALQVRQLAWRLGHFARWQAARVREGWRIVESEWSPAKREGYPKWSVPFDVDGTPIALKGRIDRIDRHPDGRWALLDYKTGDGVKTPREVHGGNRTGWKDLQLPLYTALAEEAAGEGDLQLGYVALGKSEDNITLLEAEWDEVKIGEALECARDVVRLVREGAFFEKGKAPRDEITRALYGEGLLTGDLAEADRIEAATEMAG